MTNSSTSSANKLGWLKSEHRELLREIAEMRAWWESRDKAQAINLGEMSRWVMDLHDRLASHIVREEEGKYLITASELRPELASDVAGLLDDHRKFLSSLAELAGKLARGHFRNSKRDEPWIALESILAALAEHENVENAVLAAAYGDNYRGIKESRLNR